MSILPYIVGNWKMNGTRALLTEARSIDRASARYPKVQVALAPPFTLIHRLQEAVQTIVQMIQARQNNEAVTAQPRFIQPTLVVRESA